MIYTSYDMIPDCRAGKPEGWSYFIAQYVPVVRRILAHYCPDDAGALDRVLPVLRASLFERLEPAAERPFVAELRQSVLAAAIADAASEFELAVLAEALEPLTVIEKEAVWFETMRYSPDDAGRMLRMDPATAAKNRTRAGELLRARLDRWSSTILADNGLALGRAAAAGRTESCIAAKLLLDMVDGRTTWIVRQDIERHGNGCWYCVDHFCRLHEAIDLLRGSKPLTEAEAEPIRRSLGVEAPRPSFWQRLRGVKTSGCL